MHELYTSESLREVAMVSACSINLKQLQLPYGPVLLVIMLRSAWLGVSSLCGSLAPVMGLVSWVLSH